MDRRSNTHTLENLQCGATYQLTLAAFNHIGSGTSSKTETARTRGNKPISPEIFHFIRTNITAVALELSAWLDGGCPIQYFTVEFRRHDAGGYRHNDWIVVSSNVVAKSRFSIPDLEPATQYNLRITAHNNAGSTIAEYTFETLNIHGMGNGGEFLMPSGGVTDVFTENSGSMSIQASFDIQSHFIIVIIGSVVGVLMAVIIAYFCLRSRKTFLFSIVSPNSG